MRSIDHFNLKSFDLNLLVTFDALMTERSVTRAAARLKIQQPAMSHALATLRLLLDDELLVRTGSVMQPTAKALAMAPGVQTLLQQVQGLLAPQDTFCPGTEQRVFRLGFSADLEVSVMPRLIACLQQQAPGIRLLGRHVSRGDAHTLLDTGALDSAVGCFDFDLERYHGTVLYEQSLVCCFNPARMEPGFDLTEELYTTLPHVLMTMKDDIQGCLSDALKQAGKELNVVLATSDFLTALATAASAPVIATLPDGVASQYAGHFGLVTRPVPFALRVPAVSLVWSARSHRDPASCWLRDTLLTLVKEG
ncbi:LysR substrate-binding domain-containing protein [Acetobacter farinalis]|uniref:LysR substrate-binding domain-containing protein n=1 Tax=Acetobacter farinalis TaxID=1260984 RepID=A0ABT3Q8Q6_9PROT|nr:LysR family transcriptional regulator [Acetobacter farinalis]MCX2561660.1 LysR substrate-binding domain-containing protein [Acetobacter farinalis]NHO30113.1 LysR family transcriptional regulator [Acetobacter farinalis]